MENEPRDGEIIAAMIRYGGSFAIAIAQAATVADQDNLLTLKKAFPLMWVHYAMMANFSRDNSQ